jgi:hypothetical protein
VSIISRRNLFRKAAPLAIAAVAAPAVLLAEEREAPITSSDLAHAISFSIPQEQVVRRHKTAEEWMKANRGSLNLPRGAKLAATQFDVMSQSTTFVFCHPEFPLRMPLNPVWMCDWEKGWQKPEPIAPYRYDGFIDDDQYGVIHRCFPRRGFSLALRDSAEMQGRALGMFGDVK